MSQVENHLTTTAQHLERLYKRADEINNAIGKLEMEKDDIDRVIQALEPAHRRLKLSSAATLSFTLDETFNPSDDGEGSGKDFERGNGEKKLDKPLPTPQISQVIKSA